MFYSAIASLIISSIFLESVLGGRYFGTRFLVFFVVIYCSYHVGRQGIISEINNKIDRYLIKNEMPTVKGEVGLNIDYLAELVGEYFVKKYKKHFNKEKKE